MKSYALLLGLCGAVVACGSAAADDSNDEGADALTNEPAIPADIAPANWNVQTPSDAPTPGTEPINVILTTDLSISDVFDALKAPYGFPELTWWNEVHTGVFDPTSEADWKALPDGLACISSELANIEGAAGEAGASSQDRALRVGGCFPGVIAEGESHIRLWESVKRRKVEGERTISTWYIAASQEHLCDVSIGGATKKWHCILPPGFSSIGRYINNLAQIAAPTGGYDKGRDDFISDLIVATRHRTDMEVKCTDKVTRPPSGADDGLKVTDKNGEPLARVPFDGKATYCTIMKK